jgi:hypothetical protein
LVKDLNIRPETLQLIHENTGNILEVICIGKDFLCRTLAAQKLRERLYKREYMKIKSFCTKEMVSKLKRPPTEWEKIFASYTSDRRLITRI